MRTRARRVVFLAFEEVELLDVAAPIEVLALAGRRWNFRPFKIDVCSPTPGLVATRNQLRIEANGALASAAAAEVLVVPGGYGARRALANAELATELERIGRDAEIVAGVGWGVALLARAGLLRDERLAVAKEVAEVVHESAAATTIDPHARVLASGRVITARSSGAALDLGLAIVERAFNAKMSAALATELGTMSEAPPERIEVKY